VAIIGILAAIAIPAFLGMQERSRKGTVIRGAESAEPEVRAWLHSALKGQQAGIGTQGRLYEVDSDGNGQVTSVDANNYVLGLDLGVASQLCSRYVQSKFNLQREQSPWARVGGSLWVPGAATAGKISCSHAINGTSIAVVAQDADSQVIHNKVVYTD
jgi:hypothetical protein